MSCRPAPIDEVLRSCFSTEGVQKKYYYGYYGRDAGGKNLKPPITYSERFGKEVIARSEATRQSHEIASLRSQ
jgi:hypothetical protein